MEFKLNSKFSADSPTLKKYADVLVHVTYKKEVKRFKAHKMVLAQHSEYFDNIFLCNENMPLVHICFTSVYPDVVENTLKLMYGYPVDILEKYSAKFSEFLDVLNVCYEKKEKIVKKDVDSKNRNKTAVAAPKKVVRNPSPTPVASNNKVATDDIEQYEQPKEVIAQKRSHLKSPEFKQTKKTKVENTKTTNKHTEIKITKEIESLPKVDKWTETSEDRLVDIDFKVQNVSNHGKIYKCEHCEFIHNLFTEAEKHFFLNHQDCGDAPQIFRDAIMQLKKAGASCEEIKQQLEGNCNKLLAENKLM